MLIFLSMVIYARELVGAAKPTTAIRAPGTAMRGRTALGTANRMATGVAPIVRFF